MGGGTFEVEEKPLGDISGLWRSEDMELRTMSIERSVLEQAVRRFGDISCVQFRDMNGSTDEGESKAASAKNRHFVTQVRTCESIERCLRYFDEQIHLFHIKGDMNNTYEAPLGIEEFRGVANYNDLPNALEILNHKLIADEESLRDQIDKLMKYKSEEQVEEERYNSLSWASSWVSNEGRDADDYSRRQEAAGLLGEDGTALLVVGSSAQSLGQLVGTIATEKKDVFNRMLYRVTKGNAVATLYDLENGTTCFRILYSSFEMQSRILKLTAANSANVFLGRILMGAGGQTDPRSNGISVLPENEAACSAMLEKIKAECDERNSLIASTEAAIKTQLISIQKVHKDRRHYAIREKALYHTLNMMQIDEGTCFANAIAWIPTRQLDKVSNVLSQFPLCRLNEDDLKDADPESPPTHFETNDFTATFQGIVDSYGVPRYHEINPTIFTIVTFPWLFGIMYGDIGHGIFITVTAAVLIFFQEPLKKMKLNEMVDMVFGARWLLLLMGLFAVYQGFLYNDTFGIMLDYAGTKYMWPDGWDRPEEWTSASCFDNDTVPAVCLPCHISELEEVTYSYNGLSYTVCTCQPWGQKALQQTDYSCPSWAQENSTNLVAPKNGPVPFGIDSAWSEANNKLTFYNSYKMKNAVIVGVLQMTLGLFLSLCNFLYFKDYKHLFFGFIPECMFLFCTFGYMCIMLIAKWVTPWENTNLAPNSLETMTNFFLSPGKYNEFDPTKCVHSSSGDTDCDGYQLLYKGQKEMQVILLIIAFCAVPLMMFPIPILANKEKKRREALGNQIDDEFGSRPLPPIDMQEVVIKQVIHVIEYVLGCVSNTASYLRLWALSLAHAELSEVFWNFAIIKLLHGANGWGGGAIMWVAFGAWLSATLAVLVVMEALSAFLHSLRLHWVEFQSKFYVGDGHAFTPLSFSTLIEEHEAERVEE